MKSVLESVSVQRHVRAFTSRDLALVAAFAALYLAYGYLSSIAFRTATRSMDLFFLIALLFTVLVSMIQKPWASTLLATVSGVIFLGTPAPFAVHIAISLIANGVVFDLYLRLMSKNRLPSPRDVVAAAGLGNLAMSGSGFVTLGLVGILALPVAIVVVALVADSLLGVAGALVGLGVVARFRGISQARRVSF